MFLSLTQYFRVLDCRDRTHTKNQDAVHNKREKPTLNSEIKHVSFDLLLIPVLHMLM